MMHGVDGFNGAMPMFNGRLEAKLVGKTLEECWAWAFPDSHGAVPLHIAVPAHGARASAGAAEVPAQHQEVDDLLNVCNRVLVLGQSHRPAADHCL